MVALASHLCRAQTPLGLPLNYEAVAALLAIDAKGAEHRGHRRETVTLFYAKFCYVRDFRCATCPCRQGTNNRDLVDGTCCHFARDQGRAQLLLLYHQFAQRLV